MYYYICVHKQLKINDMEADFKKGTKVCNKCGRELPISEYHKESRRKDGLSLYCKECEKERGKKKREAIKNDPVRHQKMLDAYKRYHASEKGKAKQKEWNSKRVYTEEQREHRRQYAKEYYKENHVVKRPPREFIMIEGKEYLKCPKCGEIKPKEDFFKENKNPLGYAYKCKNCKRKQQKEYMQTDAYKERISAYNKVYRQQESFIEYRKNYDRNRAGLDPYYRLTKSLRNNVSKVVRRNSRRGKTLDLIGCSIDFFKQHLEKQFLPGMTWDNYGSEWQIDHIIPCSVFDLTSRWLLFVCFNWRNTQPLWIKDNQIKRDVLPENYKEIIEEIRVAIGCKKEIILLNDVK